MSFTSSYSFSAPKTAVTPLAATTNVRNAHGSADAIRIATFASMRGGSEREEKKR